MFGIVGIYETIVPVEYQYKLMPHIHATREWYHDMVGRVTPLMHSVSSHVHHSLAHMYKEFNNQSKRALDPLYEEFSARFPSSSHLIGPSFLDRLFLCFWMLWAMRMFFRVLGRLLFSFLRRKKHVTAKPVTRAVSRAVSRAPGSPRNPDSPKNDPGSQTSRKRIVLSK